eukprot:1187032-Prorocentrum_minimum.AAC.7
MAHMKAEVANARQRESDFQVTLLDPCQPCLTLLNPSRPSSTFQPASYFIEHCTRLRQWARIKQQDDDFERLRTETSQQLADVSQAVNDKTVEKDKSLHANNKEWKEKNNALMKVGPPAPVTARVHATPQSGISWKIVSTCEPKECSLVEGGLRVALFVCTGPPALLTARVHATPRRG